MRDTVNILGVDVDRCGMEEAFSRALTFLEGEKPRSIYTPNPEIIMQAHRNPEVMRVLNRADMVVADGIGVVYASKILKKPVRERVAGCDLSLKILEYCAKSGLPVYIYGGKPGVAQKAAENLEKRFSGLLVAGVTHGYVNDTESVLDDINKSGAKLVLVCLGAPRQEVWIDENKGKTNARLFIGAGGSVDIFAGTVRRAPDVFIKLNLEWFYRLLSQPSRFVRMLDLPVFMMKVLGYRKK